MYRFVAYRFIRIIPLVIAISLITFVLLHLAPGGPAGVLAGNPRISDRDIDRIRENMGLDDPLPVQYLRWFKSTFLEFDFGTSYVTGRPVTDMIFDRLPATLYLMGTAFLLALIAGLAIGVISALTRGGIIDQLFSMVSVAGISIPVFWFGLMAILIFSIKLDLLPAGGIGDMETGGIGFKHLILPACVLGLAYLSAWGQYIRTGMIETMKLDFITTARAKGLGSPAILFKHALKRSVLPAVAAISMQVSTLFTGAVITETVFSWPGMGMMFYQGLQRHDYTRVLGIVVIAAIVIILFNFIGDTICILLDPRGREKA